MLAMALVCGFVLAGCASGPKAAAPDLTGVTSYYVRADGNDKNAGISGDAPFKTLQRTLEAAAKTPVKKVTVIGTLAGNTTIQAADPPEGPAERGGAFCVPALCILCNPAFMVSFPASSSPP
jgi:hypothetical protein